METNNSEKFYLQGKDFDKEVSRGFKGIKFEWNIIYACNYRCSHCIFDGKWEEYGKRTVYLSAEEWMERWKRVYDLYGKCLLAIGGGEPFVYPDFISIIEKITRLHYPVNISTNSSGNLEDFVKRINPEKVFLTLSFQPEIDGIEDILERVKFLKRNGFFHGYINFCAYPPYLKNIDEYIEKVNLSREKLKVIPFYGQYNDISYPDGYSKDEREMLGMDGTWEKNVKRKGSLCAAGQKSALLLPDGKVVRCGQIGERFIIGNFFSDDFKLLDKPLLCDAEICPCLETVPAEDE